VILPRAGEYAFILAQHLLDAQLAGRNSAAYCAAVQRWVDYASLLIHPPRRDPRWWIDRARFFSLLLLQYMTIII
jgi:hypothetical protein